MVIAHCPLMPRTHTAISRGGGHMGWWWDTQGGKCTPYILPQAHTANSRGGEHAGWWWDMQRGNCTLNTHATRHTAISRGGERARWWRGTEVELHTMHSSHKHAG